MLQVKDIADNLGLSRPQVRRRIKSIQDILEETDRKGVKRGKHNKLLVSQDAFSMLIQLEEYRNSGNTTKEAKDKIREDLDLQPDRSEAPRSPNSEENNPVKEPSPRSSSSRSSNPPDSLDQVIQEKEKRIEDLKQDKKDLQRDKKRLQEKNDTLEQRLLTGEVEENNKMEQLREELHQKEIELEKVRLELEKNKSPMQRFWRWWGL